MIMKTESETGIILYQSKYGATRKYARWLEEALGFACVEVGQATRDMVKQYDTVIFCGGIYASGIAGLSFLKKHIRELQDKKTAVFCVGASPYDENALAEIRARNLTGDLRGIPLFYGRGAWDEGKMTFCDRTLCRLLQKSVAKRDPAAHEPWMKALLCAAGQTCDWTDRKYLVPLLDYLKNETKN